MSTKTWDKASIVNLLHTNDKAVERALLVLLERQTLDERQVEDTRYRNDRGFTQADAPRLTRWAKQIQAGRHLSPRQLWWIRSGKSDRFPSRIGKYHRQLLEAIELKNKPSSLADLI